MRLSACDSTRWGLARPLPSEGRCLGRRTLTAKPPSPSSRRGCSRSCPKAGSPPTGTSGPSPCWARLCTPRPSRPPPVSSHYVRSCYTSHGGRPTGHSPRIPSHHIGHSPRIPSHHIGHSPPRIPSHHIGHSPPRIPSHHIGHSPPRIPSHHIGHSPPRIRSHHIGHLPPRTLPAPLATRRRIPSADARVLAVSPWQYYAKDRATLITQPKLFAEVEGCEVLPWHDDITHQYNSFAIQIPTSHSLSGDVEMLLLGSRRTLKTPRHRPPRLPCYGRPACLLGPCDAASSCPCEVLRTPCMPPGPL